MSNKLWRGIRWAVIPSALLWLAIGGAVYAQFQPNNNPTPPPANFTGVNRGTYANNGGFSIANLPACNAAQVGSMAWVTNGVASPTFNAAVSSTGGAYEPVSCTYNGTSYGWVYF